MYNLKLEEGGIVCNDFPGTFSELEGVIEFGFWNVYYKERFCALYEYLLTW